MKSYCILWNSVSKNLHYSRVSIHAGRHSTRFLNVHHRKSLLNVDINTGRRSTPVVSPGWRSAWSSHVLNKSVITSRLETQLPNMTICKSPAGCHLEKICRNFHTTTRLDAFPPLVWAVVSLSGKVVAALSGRKWRQWVKSQPPEVQQRLYRQMILKLLALAGVMMGMGYYYYYSHLQETPFTGRKRFITLTREQYLKVADYEAESLLESEGDKLVKDPKHFERIKNIMMRLVKANQDFPGMKGHQWTVFVIEDEIQNAFVLPNGNVYVYTGMMDFAQNDDQLGVILGHEMAHALLQHAAEQLSYSQMMDYIVIAVMAALWLLMPSDGIAVITQWFYNKCIDLTIHKPYSRLLESEADRVGLMLASRACFDIREGSVFWSRMAIVEDITDIKIPEFISTHPNNDNRVKMIDALIPKYMKYREECNCPRLPTVDPRTHTELLRYKAEQIKISHASRENLKKVQVQKPVFKGPPLKMQASE